MLPVRVIHADPDLRIYAHCARSGDVSGDVAFAFLNRSPHKTFIVNLLAKTEDSSVPTSAAGTISNATSAGAVLLSRSEYHLSSANQSDVFGSQVLPCCHVLYAYTPFWLRAP